MTPRLLEKYRQEIIPVIQKKFTIKNPMAVPRLQKVVINMGVGEAINDMKILEQAVDDISTITGQKPVMRRAKKAISNFKLRKGVPVGCMVTLRRAIMYEFLDRFINISLPRIRDFNGISRSSFDKQGNYTIGIPEQSIFPEIDAGKIQHPLGMDISIVFNKGPKELTLECLQLFGMPFTRIPS